MQRSGRARELRPGLRRGRFLSSTSRTVTVTRSLRPGLGHGAAAAAACTLSSRGHCQCGQPIIRGAGGTGALMQVIVAVFGLLVLGPAVSTASAAVTGTGTQVDGVAPAGSSSNELASATTGSPRPYGTRSEVSTSASGAFSCIPGTVRTYALETTVSGEATRFTITASVVITDIAPAPELGPEGPASSESAGHHDGGEQHVA
jgi:hypothetical protein